MGQISIGFSWHPIGAGQNNRDRPGRWTAYEPTGKDASELINFLQVDFEYNPEYVDTWIDLVRQHVAGQREPGLIDRGPDGAAYFGNGHVLIASDYADDDQVLMTAEQFLAVLQRVSDSMEHANYRNRTATRSNRSKSRSSPAAKTPSLSTTNAAA